MAYAQFYNRFHLAHLSRQQLIDLLLLGSALALAVAPGRWLLTTWFGAGYEGLGWLPAAGVLALICWSVSSPLVTPVRREIGLYIVCITALLRLLSQVLDINVLGALLLCVDVYAIGRLSGVQNRRRALSPVWLAVLFAFSLPLEPMAQRLVGFGLQQISALFACAWLSPWFSELACSGVRLTVQGVDVLVDVPCSGARLMSTLGCVFSALCSVYRPDLRTALWGGMLAFLLVLVGNGLRIALLAVGIVYASQLPFSVMDAVPHALVGHLVLALCTLTLWVLGARYGKQVRSAAMCALDKPNSVPVRSEPVRLFAALVLLPFALLVGAISPQPLDASISVAPPSVPGVVAGFLAETQPLNETERRYFKTYGGQAVRASYGPFGLLVVSTASPLRHLHDPAVCLAANGYTVALLGTDHERKATLYSATSVQGDTYKVAVAYVSEQGDIATSVSEVVWQWFRRPQTWSMVQRTVPVSEIGADRAADEFQTAVRRAFNLI